MQLGGLIILQIKMLKILQANINHCADAQDLLVQETMAEKIGIAIIAEPYRIANSPWWIGDSKVLQQLSGIKAIPHSHACRYVVARDMLVLGLEIWL